MNSANSQVNRNGQSPASPPSTFEQYVVLRQSPRWARFVIWGIVGVTSATALWTYFAKIEEAVPAQGKLEPAGVVQPVQAPVGGVIDEIKVKEGETVERGEVLVTLDPSETQAQLESLRDVKQRLLEENQYYRSQITAGVEATTPSEVAPEVQQLTSNRAALIQENQLYRALLSGDTPTAQLSPQQRQRLQASLGNLNAQLAMDRLEVEQLTRQLEQVRNQIANQSKALQVEQNILNSIAPLVEEGAIADTQYLRQEQEVNNRQTELNSLRQEEERLTLAISQAQEQIQQTAVASEEELLERIASNETRIADIDSQLTKIIVENEKRLEEIEGQISQLEYALDNQTLQSPLEGKVFNLKANEPGYVAQAGEPILEIVPEDTLVARVFVTNQDIGFVRQQYENQDELRVDVRIDSYPFSEFGDINGTVVHIGSDALPPDENNRQYRFPVEIELDSQRLSDVLTLQSGMAVTANIKLRKRRVITILTDLFIRKLDSLKSGG